MKLIPVYFRREMSVDSLGYSPSAAKPEQVVADWLATGLRIGLRTFDAATAADLSHIHCRDYVEFERRIRNFMEQFLNETEAARRIVFYQGGADVHVDDPLGPCEAGMFESDMRRRDRLIFELCRSHQIPVVWNLAGGYQRDELGGIPKVMALHRATMEECVRCFIGAPEPGGDRSCAPTALL